MFMKRSTRLLVAIILVLLLAVVSVSVWAAPGRQGSVPVPPRTYPGEIGEEINIGIGTVSTEGTSGRVNVKLIKDPSKKFGPATHGIYLLNYAIDVKVVQGSVNSVEVCVPLNPDWADKEMGPEIQWYLWDSDAEAWVDVETSIKEGVPPMICGTSDQAGVFSLQGQ